MKITPITAIGKARPPCQYQIKVAADVTRTRAAQYGASERKRRGIPVDQCGAQAAFTVDGEPLCRPHAGQMALNHMLGGEA